MKTVEQDNNTIVQGTKFLNFPRTAPRYDWLRGEAQKPENSLFGVSRENDLSCKHLLCRTGVEKLNLLDHFDAVIVGSGRESSRLSDVVKLPELACLLVPKQYGGR